MSNILEVKNLKKYYPIRRGLLYKIVGYNKAIDDVSLEIAEGKTLGLVGESGCGKSTFAKTVLRLTEPDEGEINFANQEITSLVAKQMRSFRKDMQIIFQNPYNSLDPRFTVFKIIQEGIDSFSIERNKKKRLELVKVILEDVGLPANSLSRYPHEFSGGQRQRISIARSLILRPKLLILDEPVSSLDVSIQAQIINLLLRLQKKLNLTYLFIAHDLNVVRCMSDTVCVMYLGKIVERAQTEELYFNPLHPYTHLLLASSPKLESKEENIRDLIKEDVIKSDHNFKGCMFWSRCPKAKDVCQAQSPELKEVKLGHFVSCHLI